MICVLIPTNEIQQSASSFPLARNWAQISFNILAHPHVRYLFYVMRRDHYEKDTQNKLVPIYCQFAKNPRTCT